MSEARSLQPGQDIRPHVGLLEAQALASALYGVQCASVRQLNSYDDKNFLLQVQEDVSTEYTWKHGYVLKVLNALDSSNPQRVVAQNKIMIYLGSKGIVCPQPVKNIHGDFYSIERIGHPNIDGPEEENKEHIIRLLTYQPGEIMYNVPCTAPLLYQIGKYIASINILLKDFHHPGFENYNSIWMLESVPQLKQFTSVITDSKKNALVTEVINVFENDIIPIVPLLDRGIIHGDFNEQNILVEKSTNGEWCVHGVIDWGDSHITCYVFELAITLCYMMLQSRDIDPLESPGHVIAGYITKRKLIQKEFQLLKKCICARLCQSLVLGAYTHTLDPKNEYLLVTAARGWELLTLLWNTPEESLHEKWREITDNYLKK